jgi:hypothetical protein
MKIKFFIPIVIFVLFSINTYAKVYLIKAGNHEASGINIAGFSSGSLSFSAKFDNSAEYYLGNVNQYDINKLHGFSDCFTPHHRNSARFGWVWNDKSLKLEIHAYVYANGTRFMKFVDNVSLNSIHSYQIIVNGNTYDFLFNGKKVSLPRGCRSINAHGYKMNPYFGGNEVAPHDITIEVN